MILSRIKILIFSFANAMLFLLLLCLGSQNLRDKHSIDFIFSKTEEYPTGFLIGTSIILGVLSAGSSKALLISKRDDDL